VSLPHGDVSFLFHIEASANLILINYPPSQPSIIVLIFWRLVQEANRPSKHNTKDRTLRLLHNVGLVPGYVTILQLATELAYQQPIGRL
jgi:hypothetical protein